MTARIDPAFGTERPLETRLRSIVAASPILRMVLDRWSLIDLPDCWLSGSAIAQTVWNDALALPSHHGLADIDIVYFDAADLSERGEADQASRVQALLSDLPLKVDVKNEARVHLWYEAKFGYPIAPYRSSEQAITTFPTTAGAVAIRPGVDALSIFAPFGLTDMFERTARANKIQITQAIYAAKVERWRRCWPDLTIVPWDDGD